MKYKILLLTATLLLTAPLFAAEKADEVTVTPGQAIERAMEGSRELRLMESEVAAQKKLVDFAPYNVNNPELRMQDISTKYADEDEGDNRQFQIGLRWQPPRIGELGEDEQRQRVELWKKRVEASQARFDLTARVQRKYAELLMLQTELKLFERLSELEERRYEMIKVLLAEGQKTLSDLTKARRRSLKAAMELGRIAGRYEEKRRSFAAMLQLGENLRVAEVEPPLELPPEEELRSRVSEGDEMQLARQRGELVERRYKAARYRLIPWFSFVEASYHYESNKRDWGELLLGIELPLFNWNLGQLRATDIQRAGAADIKRATLEKNNTDLDSALSKYRQSVAEYRAVKDEAERSLVQSEALANEARRQSLPEDEILDMEISDNELRRMLAESAYSVAASAIEVCRVSGDTDCRALKD